MFVANTINIGIIGLGGMGRTHFACYGRNEAARVVAVCSSDERKRRGEWDAQALNVGAREAQHVDLSQVSTYEDWRALIADPQVQVVDVCLPTPQHAEVALAAIEAGKHVICEKPLARTQADAQAMADAARAAGRQLYVGHCLRYWPQYVAAQELIAGGQLGNALRAEFHRSCETPPWSAHNWLLDGAQSGGAILDLHIHDVDCAQWWFGVPQGIQARGRVQDGLPMSVDSLWAYESGLTVALHGSWDVNPVPFRMAFRVVMERGTLIYDSALSDELRLYNAVGESVVAVSAAEGYQAQLDDFVACALGNRPATRVSVESSQASLELTLETLRQIETG